MPRPLHEQIVVLTGASSGIGRATALELARRGAAVVLAARSDEALHAVAQEIDAAGGRNAVVVTDVADWSQVERLAGQAVNLFGRIDTWVNNAAISEYATVDDATIEEIDRVLQVNLHGTIYGVKAALPVLRRQGGGTIVNVSSVLGKLAVPLQAAYCASKHGVVGFADALRLELKRDGSNIDVCTVLPSSINTPFFSHARAKLGGRKPQPIPPAYDPQAVAEAIAFACEHPRREIVVGGAGKAFEILQRINPALLDWFLLMGDSGARLQTSDRPDDGTDNLAGPVRGEQPAKGEWSTMDLGRSSYTRVFEHHPMAKAVAVGAAAVVGAGLLRWLSGGRRAGPRTH
jgi:NAD(P)-dependent dehydrogenase (short-subunit alcohol dehydrogenase family)